MAEAKKNIHGRNLPWWTRLILILLCTAICGSLAYLYCEKITSPRYVDTVSAVFTVNDVDTLLANSDSSITVRTLNIRGALLEELGSVGSKNKGLFYRNITDDIQALTAEDGSEGMLIKPRELKDMISISDGEDGAVLITVKAGDAETAQLIAESASRQFGILVFGDEATADQAEVTVEAANDDGTQWLVTFAVTEAAANQLGDKFYGVALDLVTAMNAALNDTAFIKEVADAAGVSDAVSTVQKRISFTTTADSAVLILRASWDNLETADKLVAAEGDVLARRLFGGQHDPWQATVSEPTIVSEHVREWPATLPIVVIVSLIALVVSYAVLSRQSLFDTIIILFFVLFTFICVFPFYYLFINTISANDLVAGGQINFFPQGIHLKNYQRILAEPELSNALIVTVARTIIGTALMVLTSAWAGYLVTKQKMWKRSFWYRALVVTMYFNAGLIPWYTNMLMLGLTGNFLAYIIPGMVAPYNIILVKTYIESIPASLEESAIIDGASTLRVFRRIILPLSVPILATIAVFGAVGNWNSFQDSLLLMSSSPNLYTLQHRLYIYLNQTTSMNTEMITEQMAQNLLNTGVTTKYTIAMITIIPILLVYPFMQRYFVKGIMLGAVKG